MPRRADRHIRRYFNRAGDEEGGAGGRGGRGGGVGGYGDDTSSDSSDVEVDPPAVRNLRYVWACTDVDCYEQYRSQRRFERHHHDDPRQHKCLRCLNLFQNREDLRNHIADGHIGRVPVCRAAEVFGPHLRTMHLGITEREIITAFDPSLLEPTPDLLSSTDLSSS